MTDPQPRSTTIASSPRCTGNGSGASNAGATTLLTRLAFGEVLRIAGWSRWGIDAIATIRGIFPLHYFRFGSLRDFYYAARWHVGRECVQARPFARVQAAWHVRRGAPLARRTFPRRERFSRPLRQSSRRAWAGCALGCRSGRGADLYGGRHRRQHTSAIRFAACATAASILIPATTACWRAIATRTTVWPRLRLCDRGLPFPQAAPRGQARRPVGAPQAGVCQCFRAALPP